VIEAETDELESTERTEDEGVEGGRREMIFSRNVRDATG
jgi:hypothetical protein